MLRDYANGAHQIINAYTKLLHVHFELVHVAALLIHPDCQLIHSCSQLIDTPIGLDFTFRQGEHHVVKAYDVVGKLLNAAGKRTDDGLQPAQPFVVHSLVSQ